MCVCATPYFNTVGVVLECMQFSHVVVYLGQLTITTQCYTLISDSNSLIPISLNWKVILIGYDNKIIEQTTTTSQNL